MSGEYKEHSERTLHETATSDKRTPPARNLPKTGKRSPAPGVAPPSRPEDDQATETQAEGREGSKANRRAASYAAEWNLKSKSTMGDLPVRGIWGHPHTIQ